ncbi:uncharacterized protein PFL1_03057 [Pseudozyma flocculosa PF-1]|uniref:Uncharacterized protein n=2 Tax=Pseudozyma flocculosa TaxID=84751 RepID=A0A5C3F1L2_9BASI|nr:uncharacterized protein PFL1_03057 [Pseudozyma flocculosa PF-1]EPQ29302.1 hypothetical protein PFL1_03057 [Pseudozyma flocculosa PF-1]SPO37816.1 uncharacterized protein PSFLO_03292 [Pseudozyma flocculosa]
MSANAVEQGGRRHADERQGVFGTDAAGDASNAAAAATVQETHFAATEHGDAVADHNERLRASSPSTSSSTQASATISNDSQPGQAGSRHGKKLSYGSITNGFPRSAPSFSPPSSGVHPSAPPPPGPAAGAGKTRVLAPDLLRGLLMVLQSIDHSAMQMGVWQHGVGKVTEGDGTVVHEWNPGRAWIARTLTHLCAPGFMFLLGMGTVYFTRSRTNLGWSPSRLLRHYFIRMVALLLVEEVLGFILMWNRATKVLILNIVLLALAVNYFLSGLLCLFFRYTEPRLARLLAPLFGHAGADAARESDDETQGGERSRLIAPSSTTPTTTTAGEESSPSCANLSRATSLSWHIHNLILLVLSLLSIFGNVLLSPHAGRCASASDSTSTSSGPLSSSALVDFVTAAAADAPATPPSSGHGALFDFLFFPVINQYIVSPFPPLAWTSFAVFGILYARIVLARKWSPNAVVCGNLATAVVLAILFVCTRLLHFGNLSEDCLRMPEHLAHPGRNQYLASFRSFFYIVKYPPSVAYFSMTMSLNFFLLAFFGAIPANWAVKIPGLMNFGSSALFFYATHFVVYKLLSIPAYRLFAHRLPDNDPNTGQPTYGLGDTAAYWLFWLLGLFILSPLCRVYGRFKSRQPADSIWRFF